MAAQGLPWSPIGGIEVSAMIALWTPLDAKRRHNDGKKGAETSLKLIPLCIHSATTTMRVPSFCLFWPICGRPTSSATFVRLFWTCSKLHSDHGVHGEVWTSSVPPWNDQGKLSASFVPSTVTWPVFGRTREAQSCSPCVRGYYIETRSSGFRQPLSVSVIFWSLRGDMKVAVMCKGGLSDSR